MKKSIEVATKLKQEVILISLNCHRQVALNLMGKSKSRALLVGESYNEIEMIPYLIKKNNKADLGSLCSLKALLCIIFDDSKDSFRIALESEKYKETSIGLVYRIFIYFYSSLIYLSHYPGASIRKRFLYQFRVYFNQKQLKKWARYAPENLMHKWHLVEAERAKTRGNHMHTIKHYDKALSLARQNGYIHEEALAYELAAKYYLTGGLTRLPGHILKKPVIYTQYGALWAK